VRRGSGGAGAHRGGDGARRVLQFTEPVTLTLLTGNRGHPPYGLASGSPGAPGEQWVRRADGSRTELAGCDSVELAAGDALVLLTPGGGGYGAPAGEAPLLGPAAVGDEVRVLLLQVGDEVPAVDLIAEPALAAGDDHRGDLRGGRLHLWGGAHLTAGVRGLDHHRAGAAPGRERVGLHQPRL